MKNNHRIIKRRSSYIFAIFKINDIDDIDKLITRFIFNLLKI